jgi:hypothetical protein
MLNQPKLYLVTINLGGWIHDKIYTLRRCKSEWDKGYDYWDPTGNHGFMSENKRKLGPRKEGGEWQFLFEKKEDAKLFLDGALAARDFMVKTWCQY